MTEFTETLLFQRQEEATIVSEISTNLKVGLPQSAQYGTRHS